MPRSASNPCRMDSLHLGPLPQTAADPSRGDNLSPALLERSPRVERSPSKARSPPQKGAYGLPPYAVDLETSCPPTPLPRFDRRVAPPNAPLMRILPFGSRASTRSLQLTLARSRARCISRAPPNRKELKVERPPTPLSTATVFLSAPLFVSARRKKSLDSTHDSVTALSVGGVAHDTLP